MSKFAKKLFPKCSVQSYLVLMYLFPFLYEIFKLKGELKLINVLNLLDPINDGEGEDLPALRHFHVVTSKNTKNRHAIVFLTFNVRRFCTPLENFSTIPHLPQILQTSI